MVWQCARHINLTVAAGKAALAEEGRLSPASWTRLTSCCCAAAAWPKSEDLMTVWNSSSAMSLLHLPCLQMHIH